LSASSEIGARQGTGAGKLVFLGTSASGVGHLVTVHGGCAEETLWAMGVTFTAREGQLGEFLVPCGPRRDSAPVGLGEEVVLGGEKLGTLRCDLAPMEIK
jgi:hypothetical protein